MTEGIKMKFRVLLLDETEHWREDIVKAAGGQVFGVYLYNPNQVTHCCEFTPSFALTFLNSIPLEYPDGEEAREQLHDDLIDGNVHCEPITYVHCHDVDKLPHIRRGEFKVGTYSLKQGYSFDDEETAQEFWAGNPDY
jgi:hypothetical protein